MSAWSVRRDARRVFKDRREAGRSLARILGRYQGEPGLLVLGLARGGIPIAWEVASFLGAPLDVFVVRKLGVPHSPELAMGALASGGGVVVNEELVRRLGISQDDVADAIARETVELDRRQRAYRGARPTPDVTDRIVILVDDGIATGASMLAAVRAVHGARRVVVAVPVAPPSACGQLAEEADDVVCASMPPHFDAVGQAFADFHQVTDDEVRQLLETPTAG